MSNNLDANDGGNGVDEGDDDVDCEIGGWPLLVL